MAKRTTVVVSCVQGIFPDAPVVPRRVQVSTCPNLSFSGDDSSPGNLLPTATPFLRVRRLRVFTTDG
ncbi:hypothetical protein QLX08_005086 [Tetragonisca angustula]|uniref:Uncharacterized protein n=1 Tax=Tetragonisca angustula TaxID=166442 RepID=A0AAW1A1U7_9HYME